MNRTKPLLLLAVAALVAGCTQVPSGGYNQSNPNGTDLIVNASPDTPPPVPVAPPPDIFPEPAYGVEVTGAPTAVPAFSPVAVSWDVLANPPATAAHTAVHYDSISHPGTFGTDVSPAASGYANLTADYASGSFPVPDGFAASIPGLGVGKTIYFRAHAIINGKNYWTDERAVAMESIAAPASASLALEADDNGFYPNSTITVANGTDVTLTFTVRTTNVYFGGLDIRSDDGTTFSTGTIKPGESKSVTFTVTKLVSFTSYWPLTSAIKASGRVQVA